MFATKEQLAAALGIELVPAIGLMGMTDGTWVADTGPGLRDIAQALLVRGGVDHNHETIDNLERVLRALLR